jgi:PGF-CTERM protein
VGSYDHNVYALNASTGAKVWNYTTGLMVLSSPAVANGVVYVGSDDNNLYALNASTGAKLWSYRTGLWVEANPAITNGVVYVGSDDGNVYAFSTVSSTTTTSGGFLGLPGFEAVYAVAGVLAVAYVLMRRKR